MNLFVSNIKAKKRLFAVAFSRKPKYTPCLRVFKWEVEQGLEYRFKCHFLWLTINWLLWTKTSQNPSSQSNLTEIKTLWGLERSGDELWITWNGRGKTWELPFCTLIFQHHNIMASGFVPCRCTLKNGQVQQVNAAFTIEQRTFRRKWTWLHVAHKTIEVVFDDVVGEHGAMGYSCELRANETAEQCLQRIEKDRTF